MRLIPSHWDWLPKMVSLLQSRAASEVPKVVVGWNRAVSKTSRGRFVCFGDFLLN